MAVPMTKNTRHQGKAAFLCGAQKKFERGLDLFYVAVHIPNVLLAREGF